MDLIDPIKSAEELERTIITSGDMLLDYERAYAETFVLWSGDSDFADPIEQLLDDGKNVILFATVGRVAKELNGLRAKGLFIFDIQKIRNFICWNGEIDHKRKRDPNKCGL